MPRLARPGYRLELTSILLFSFTLAMVEGGVIGVFVKNAFDQKVSGRFLDYAAGTVTAAGELANIASFFWILVTHGRAKVPVINKLQVATGLLVALIACAPRNSLGLLAVVLCVLSARIAWSGIVTVRPTIWRSNYARDVRPRVVGNFSAIQVAVVATMGLTLGFLMDRFDNAFRYVLPAAGVSAYFAFLVFRRMPVRGEAAELREEEDLRRPHVGELIRLVMRDRFFAKFQLWMFVLGLGNLMLTPILILTLKEEFGMGYFQSILITTGIIQLATPLFIPMWARVLNRAHVVQFRSVHSWAFVVALLLMMAGTHFHLVWLMYVGALVQAIGTAGGAIAWHIGHHDFAPANQTSRYMAVHVTLNGLRGLLAPLLAVTGYHALHGARVEASTLMLMVCCTVCIGGAIGFGLLRREMGRERLKLVRNT